MRSPFRGAARHTETGSPAEQKATKLGPNASRTDAIGRGRVGTIGFVGLGNMAGPIAAEPIPAATGRRVVHCGGPGAGQAAKICNNMILGITMVGLSEAFVLAERLGLSYQALFDVASTSSGSCWALTTHCPVPGPVPTSAANHGYRPGFAAALMLMLMQKDLRLSQEAAQGTATRTPLGARAAALYEAFAAGGHGGDDYSAIVEFIRAGALTQA